MTRINGMSVETQRHPVARAVILAAFVVTLAACGGGDYGPSTSNRIGSDIASSRWVNQLPPAIPDAQNQTVE